MPNSVYAGIPVKYICSMEEYKDKNIDKFDETGHFKPDDKKVFLLKKYNLSKDI